MEHRAYRCSAFRGDHNAAFDGVRALHLVRGRDAEKPPVVVLVDSDTAGDEAVKVLKRKPLSGMLASDLVLQLGKAPHEVGGVSEIEDLIPWIWLRRLQNACLQELAMYRAGSAAKVKAGEIEAAEGTGVFDRLIAVLAAKDAKIEKLPFARAIVRICEERAD